MKLTGDLIHYLTHLKAFVRKLFLRLRILQIVMISLVLMVTAKINHLRKSAQSSDFTISMSPLFAESTAPAKDAPADESKKSGADDKKNLDMMGLTAEEYQVLSNLNKRRSAIEDKERSLPEKEKILKSVEKRIDDKLKELKAIQEELKKLVTSIEEDEKASITRLVKMLENMKPEDASKRLQGMDFSLMLEIMEQISVKKASAILSNLDPAKASFLLTELAKRKRYFKTGKPGQGVMRSPDGAPENAASPETPVAPSDETAQPKEKADTQETKDKSKDEKKDEKSDTTKDAPEEKKESKDKPKEKS